MEDEPKGSVPRVADRLDIWCILEQVYNRGTARDFNSQDGIFLIHFDDGDIEYLDMRNERWRRLSNDAEPKIEPNLQGFSETLKTTTTATATSDATVVHNSNRIFQPQANLSPSAASSVVLGIESKSKPLTELEPPKTLSKRTYRGYNRPCFQS